MVGGREKRLRHMELEFSLVFKRRSLDGERQWYAENLYPGIREALTVVILKYLE